MEKKRKRDVPQLFFISKDEERLLAEKMSEAGIRNKSAYFRKMTLDGYIIKQDFSAVKAVVNELSRIGNNLNQVTKIANTYGDVYVSELKSIREGIDKVWQQLSSKVYLADYDRSNTYFYKRGIDLQGKDIQYITLNLQED